LIPGPQKGLLRALGAAELDRPYSLFALHGDHSSARDEPIAKLPDLPRTPDFY